MPILIRIPSLTIRKKKSKESEEADERENIDYEPVESARQSAQEKEAPRQSKDDL